jgi:hypothetical protein
VAGSGTGIEPEFVGPRTGDAGTGMDCRLVSALLMGLPRSGGEAQAEFDRLIQQTFPPGSDEALLSEALNAQGFKRTDSSSNVGADPTGAIRIAMYKLQKSKCVYTYAVAWRAAADKIAEVGGRFKGVCRIDVESLVPLELAPPTGEGTETKARERRGDSRLRQNPK